MPTYLIKKEKTIIRQQGDTSDITFVFPEIINPEEYDINFSVYSNVSQGTLVFQKTQDDMEIAEQRVTIPIDREDTATVSGERYWELVIYNEHVTHTIGKGTFKIVKIYGSNYN